MAEDDRYRWLDRATAECLLSGASLEASPASADPEARDRAEQLAKTLESLSVGAPPCGAELPGEAAALAAFRKARPAPDLSTAAPAQPSPDMGLVRVGRFGSSGVSRRSAVRPARWGRPLYVGLGAALAAGMVGSVAMAAGIGVLSNPFGGEEPGRPAATESAAESRDPLPAPPSPDDGNRGRRGPSFRPDTATGGSADRGAAGRDEPQADPTDGAIRPRSDMSQPGAWRDLLASSCRDMRSGMELDAERRRALEKAAKGSMRVPKYCEHALKHEPAGRSHSGNGKGTGEGRGAIGAEGGRGGAGDNGGKGDGATGGHGYGNGGGNSHGNGKGKGDGNGNGNGKGRGHGGRAAVRPTPTPTSFAAPGADEPRDKPAPDPGPSYGVLPLPTAT